MDYADFNLVPQTKSLGTDSFTAEILTTHAIASFADVASGTTLSATWEAPGAGLHGWYVTTTDPFGAVDRSAVQLLTVAAGPVVPGGPPTLPGRPGTGGGGSSGTTAPSTGASGTTTQAATSSGKAAGKAAGELAMTGTSAGLFLALGLALSLLTVGAAAVVAARTRRGARD